MKNISFVLLIVAALGMPFSGRSSANSPSDIRLIKGFRNTDNKFLLFAELNSDGNSPAGGLEQHLVVFWGDSQTVHQLRTSDFETPPAASDQFEFSFFAYKSINNPTRVVGANDRIIVSIDDTDGLKRDEYIRLANADLEVFKDRFRSGAIHVEEFPDVSSTHETVMWPRTYDEPFFTLRVEKQVLDSEKVFFYWDDITTQVSNAQLSALNRLGFGGEQVLGDSQGNKLVIERGIGGEIQGISFRESETGTTHELGYVEFPGRQTAFRNVEGGPVVPVYTPIDQFYGPNGGMGLLKRRMEATMSMPKRKSCLSAVLGWFGRRPKSN
ncbi:MAG: hypothetical protein IPJ71_11340 [Bdellovibrionales bacterium]|nr:hypothetical protein [Bdellovibrionales bacterium]